MTEDIEEIKEEQPLVSVVIPTYNRSKELARAIKSVLNQTYQDFEILVVDDGSEEDLKVVCGSFNDSRIRFLRNEIHTNANVARNRGLKEAKGEYIAMLDSDDEYLPHHLSRRIEKIEEWNCDGIFGSAYIDNSEEQILKLSRPLRNGELMINYLLSDGFAPTPSHFYTASAAKMILWDESLLRHQDYDFSVRFTEKYNFKSDYEPTIVINWDKQIVWDSNYWESCKTFITKHKSSISINNLLNYHFQIATKYSSFKNAVDNTYLKWILKEIESRINFVSLTDYTQLQTKIGKSKTRSTINYLKHLLLRK